MPGILPTRLTTIRSLLLPVRTFTALLMVMLSKLTPFTSISLSPTVSLACAAVARGRQIKIPGVPSQILPVLPAELSSSTLLTNMPSPCSEPPRTLKPRRPSGLLSTVSVWMSSLSSPPANTGDKKHFLNYSFVRVKISFMFQIKLLTDSKLEFKLSISCLCYRSNKCPLSCLKLTISRGINKNDPAHWGGGPAPVRMFLQHIARGAVGPPRLASSVEMGVPTSICHLRPVRGERGVRHINRPSVIQTGGYLGSAVRVVEKEIQLGMEWMLFPSGWSWRWYSRPFEAESRA